MNIPPFWAKSQYQGESSAKSDPVVAHGWSFSSLQEAKEDALARAKRVFDLLAHDQKPPLYEYHDRPIREEILKQISDAGSPIALITRNRYGALVLNCSNVLFVDVDFPKAKPEGIIESLAWVFCSEKRTNKQQLLIQQTIRQIEEWAQNHPLHSFRLYRTREGLRLLFTDKLYDPKSTETANLFQELHADPLYAKLTQKHECFRARLTAKPWRCNCPKPPSTFPWDNPEIEKKFRQWEAMYTKCDADYKVCELIREFGSPASLSTITTILQVHDRASRIINNTPLA